MRPTCTQCDRPAASKGKAGYHLLCNRHHGQKYLVGGYRRQKHSRFKKDSCEECGFVPKHSCQLDVDHVDEDHTNNSSENLRTLCANCHRLKTFLERN